MCGQSRKGGRWGTTQGATSADSLTTAGQYTACGRETAVEAVRDHDRDARDHCTIILAERMFRVRRKEGEDNVLVLQVEPEISSP